MNCSTNAGGFTRGSAAPNFVKSLRDHERIRNSLSIRETDYYLKAQGIRLLPREAKAESQKRKTVDNLVQRLSVPKQPQQPWKNSAHPSYTQSRQARCRSAGVRERRVSTSGQSPCDETHINNRSLNLSNLH
jgi:hypothetical protein